MPNVTEWNVDPGLWSFGGVDGLDVEMIVMAKKGQEIIGNYGI